jgi:pimeloyl-ACP methyl ester carboxylesterase
MKHKFIKFIKIFVISLLTLLIISIITGMIVMHFSKVSDKNPLILEKVHINGNNQWISLTESTSSSKKPVILFLHGGPGSANISILNQLCPGLRDHAIVANWDQRGAGKSYSVFGSDGKLSLEQNIKDAHVLTKYLKEKFKVDKITLIGFSAGTALGMLLINRYPEDYDLFISTAQFVDGKRGEQLSLEYSLQEAHKRNNKEAIEALEKISFDFSQPETILNQTEKERSYLLKFGGVYHTYNGYSHEIKSIWKSNEYTFFDFVFWPIATLSSLKAMWPEYVLLNLEELVPQVNVPVVFFCGKYDMNCPHQLAEEYFNKLVADKGKKLVIFENSAHGIFWDEPIRFEQAVINALENMRK